MTPQFTYDSAFSRNRGWVTVAEQQVLRRKRVAIAGLGGVGGAHLLTLARLGIGRFHISDFDTFDVPNFNRQAGAFVSSLGKPKSEVLAAMARDINPEVDVAVFDQGVNAQNVDAFLDGVDLYVDGLDFFAFAARKLVFPRCAQRGIPATTAAPLGMGSAILNFVPGGMTFEKYFRWDDCSEDEMALRFLIGLSPAMLQRGYLVDKSAVDFAARKGPSTPMACEICAGMAGTQALKILLGRGKLVVAPHGLHFDAYRNKMVKTWRPGGNANPLQRIAIWIAGKQLARMAQASPGVMARPD
jgi:molybdopterin/thiamine biosynthesis adenylyltransferase